MHKVLSCLIFLWTFVGVQADMGEVVNCKNAAGCSVQVDCPNCARVLSISLFDKNGQEHPVDNFQMNYDSGKVYIDGMDLGSYDYLVCTFLNGNGKETSQRVQLLGRVTHKFSSSSFNSIPR